MAEPVRRGLRPARCGGLTSPDPVRAPTATTATPTRPRPEEPRTSRRTGGRQDTRGPIQLRKLLVQESGWKRPTGIGRWIEDKGDKAPIQAGQRWPVERTNAWHNGFNRLQRCYERKEEVIDAFFDLADTIITVRRLIRESWTLYRWDSRPAKRP